MKTDKSSTKQKGPKPTPIREHQLKVAIKEEKGGRLGLWTKKK